MICWGVRKGGLPGTVIVIGVVGLTTEGIYPPTIGVPNTVANFVRGDRSYRKVLGRKFASWLRGPRWECWGPNGKGCAGRGNACRHGCNQCRGSCSRSVCNRAIGSDGVCYPSERVDTTSERSSCQGCPQCHN